MGAWVPFCTDRVGGAWRAHQRAAAVAVGMGAWVPFCTDRVGGATAPTLARRCRGQGEKRKNGACLFIKPRPAPSGYGGHSLPASAVEGHGQRHRPAAPAVEGVVPARLPSPPCRRATGQRWTYRHRDTPTRYATANSAQRSMARRHGHRQRHQHRQGTDQVRHHPPTSSTDARATPASTSVKWVKIG